jgi:hypothetical protein
LSVGALSHESLDGLLYQIEIPSFHSSHLADLDGVYPLHRFQVLPMDLEVQGEVARRFGMDHQSEVDLISVVRWKKFPWNDKLKPISVSIFIGLHHRSGIFWLDQRCYGRIELLHGGTALSGRLSSRLPTRFYRPRNDFFGRVPLRHHDWYRRNIFRRLIDISLPKDLQRVELTWQKVSDSAVARICNTRESVEFGECKKFFKFERNVWFRAVLFA